MSDNLRNFNLTVEEIKLVRTIDDLIEGLEKLEIQDPMSPRADFFRKEIDKLEEKLDEIRDNTLIR